ncbi:hypothetical protein NLI96_g12661 [Meripilus lineatus]|uniref:F-box domain-containing protein n=1 Tax=Meripilus lineatus TaxID=2056292 RepID=A0AAD5UPE5_9APHY|nr:hypothetical protein NLI96_g12661 [Physisporinus lineatus]
MDSDDEEMLNQLELQARTKDWYGYNRGIFTTSIRWSRRNGVYLKLHQAKEWGCVRREYARWRDAVVNGLEIDRRRNSSALYRVKRFCESIQGFHEGNLDLTGRHESRYQQLYARWNRFLADVLHLSLHATEVEVPVEEDEEIVMEIDYTVDRPEVLEKFQKDWKVWAISLEFIFRHTKRTLECLSEHPTPVFQKLLLRDFPPELIHHIMFLANSADAQRLGSTSKYFRKTSLSHIYISRIFDIPFRPIPLVPGAPADSFHQQKQIRAAGDTLVEELDFVLSRPDILESLQHVTMFGQWYGLVKKILGFESGSREYRNFFGPFESRVGPILRRIPKLKTLTLTGQTISNEIVNALESSRNLHSIEVHSAQITARKTTAPPQYPSVINADLVFDSDETLSLWGLLRSFPNLRSLELRFSRGLTGIELEADLRTRFNPFRTLERVIIEKAEPEHIEVITDWIQSSPSLKLTHLCLEGGRPGIFLRQTRELLLALNPAPLQVLILDGLYYAEPDLLDTIAGIFPNLRALTLLYRQTRSRVSTWPRTSW